MVRVFKASSVWEVGVSDSQTEPAERTYFEDLKDPIEFHLPGIDYLPAIPHVGRLGA